MTLTAWKSESAGVSLRSTPTEKTPHLRAESQKAQGSIWDRCPQQVGTTLTPWTAKTSEGELGIVDRSEQTRHLLAER